MAIFKQREAHSIVFDPRSEHPILTVPRKRKPVAKGCAMGTGLVIFVAGWLLPQRFESTNEARAAGNENIQPIDPSRKKHGRTTGPGVLDLVELTIAILSWLLPREQLLQLLRRDRPFDKRIRRLIADAQSPLWASEPASKILAKIETELRAIAADPWGLLPGEQRKLAQAIALVNELRNRFGDSDLVDAQEAAVLIRSRLDAEWNHGGRVTDRYL